MTMVFVPKAGSRISPNAAQVVGERIHSLAANGPVTADRIVEDARPESSPTHDFFEWDNDTAAGKYRLWQARHYLCNIEIVRDDNHPPVRAFYTVVQMPQTEQGTPERGALPLEIVRANRDLWQQVINEERRRLIATQRRLRMYEELAPVADGPLQIAIEALMDITSSNEQQWEGASIAVSPNS